MKKHITCAFLAVTLSIATVVFVPSVARAQTSDFGSGGSTGIIGLPSGRAYFQDAASQAQSGSYNNPVGGSGLLQENKSALLIVDSPFSSATPSSEPEVSNANIWWAFILGIAALLSLVGMMIILLPKRLWHTEEQERVEVEEESEVLEEPQVAQETISEPQASETPAVIEPVVTETEEQQSQAMAEEVLEAISQDGELNKVQVVEIETEEEIEQAAKKSSKKRKHGGRPTKKSHK